MKPTDDSLLDELRSAIAAGTPSVLATCTAGADVGAKVLVVATDPSPQRWRATTTPWMDDRLREAVARDAAAVISTARSGTRQYGAQGRLDGTDTVVFFEAFAPPPRLVIFGAVDFTAALAHVGKILGFHVVVCDARPTFATAARFPMADEVVVDWPDRYLEAHGADLGPRDAVCVLTHDPKFDVPAVTAALASRVGYIGAMGSRRTTKDREDRLREHGVTEAELERILAPIGLDVGARTPEETAVAICAEIIALQTGHLAPSLRDGSGPIHA